MKKFLFIPSWYPIFGVTAGNYFADLFSFYKKALPDCNLVFISLEKKKLNSLIKYFILNNIFIKRAYFFYTYFVRVEHNLINNEGKLFIQISTYFSSERSLGEQGIYLEQLTYAYTKTIRKYFTGDLYILAQSMEFAGLVSYRINKKYSNIKYSISEHNYFTTGRFVNNLLPTVRSAYSNADILFYCSHSKMQQVLATGLNLNIRNFVNYNFVKEPINIIEKYKSGKILRIIIVAAASHFKDINTALCALIEVKKKTSVDFSVKLVGVSSWGNSDKYIDERLLFALRDEIEIVPFAKNNDLINLYLNSNIFLLTSLAEGMPVSLLEAMNFGLIPIVTRHGGSEEVVINELHGFIVNIRDVDGVSKSLIDIYLGKFIHVPELNSRRARNFSDYNSFYKNTVSKFLDFELI
jgi:glycosyltransferase involved in cell wall biosynthesis